VASSSLSSWSSFPTMSMTSVSLALLSDNGTDLSEDTLSTKSHAPIASSPNDNAVSNNSGSADGSSMIDPDGDLS
jgi:hypothetical protein